MERGRGQGRSGGRGRWRFRGQAVSKIYVQYGSGLFRDNCRKRFTLRLQESRDPALVKFLPGARLRRPYPHAE